MDGEKFFKIRKLTNVIVVMMDIVFILIMMSFATFGQGFYHLFENQTFHFVFVQYGSWIIVFNVLYFWQTSKYLKRKMRGTEEYS